MTTKVPKFYYRPDLNILESVENPSPLRSTERTEKKTDPTAGAKYVSKEQRTYETLKLPGYETPEKSDVSYKKLKEKALTVDDYGPVKYDKNGLPNKATPEQMGAAAERLERMHQMEGKPDKLIPKKVNTYSEVKISIPTIINHSLLRKSAADKVKAAAIEKVRQYAFSKKPDPDTIRGIGSFANTIGRKLRATESKRNWERNQKTIYEDNHDKKK